MAESPKLKRHIENLKNMKFGCSVFRIFDLFFENIGNVVWQSNCIVWQPNCIEWQSNCIELHRMAVHKAPRPTATKTQGTKTQGTRPKAPGPRH